MPVLIGAAARPGRGRSGVAPCAARRRRRVPGCVRPRRPGVAAVARVFVSHASTDMALADEVHRWLVEDGHEVFLDQDLRDGIVVGEEWEQRLHERLRWADAVVCLLTSAYLASVVVYRRAGDRAVPGQPAAAGAGRTRGGPSAADGGAAGRRDRRTCAWPGRSWPRRCGGSTPPAGSGWPDDRSPFPGLRPFDTDQHRVFFGRSPGDRAAGDAAALPGRARRGRGAAGGGPVRVREVVAGAGRAAAGDGRRTRLADGAGDPAGDPAGGGADPGTRRDRPPARAGLVDGRRCAAGSTTAGWPSSPTTCCWPGPGPRRTHLLIVVDQFEELLTQAAPAERARFAGLLGAGAGRPGAGRRHAAPGIPRPAAGSTRSWPACPTRVHTLRAAAPGGAARGDRGPGAAGRHRGGRGPGGAAGRRHRQRGGVAAAGLHPGPAGRRGGARAAAAGQPV